MTIINGQERSFLKLQSEINQMAGSLFLYLGTILAPRKGWYSFCDKGKPDYRVYPKVGSLL